MFSLKTLTAMLVSLSAFSVPNSLWATVTTFTDRAAWQSALQGVSTESFEAELVGDYSTPFSTTQGTQAQTVSGAAGTIQVVSGGLTNGTRELRFREFGPGMLFMLSAYTRAVAFDYTTSGENWRVEVAGGVATLQANSTGFIGFIDDSSLLRSFKLSSSSLIQGGVSLDDLSLEVVASKIFVRPIAALSGTAGPIIIDLGSGPQSTGPISYELEPSTSNTMRFNMLHGLAEIDIHLLIDFPLLDQIGSPPLRIRLREAGPVTWGVDPVTRQIAGWSSLTGGGVFEGGIFAGGVFYNKNGWEIVINGTHANNAPSPPTPYPELFSPFPPPVADITADPIPLMPPFSALSDAQVEAWLPTASGDANFGFAGFFRFPGQTGDIPVHGDGIWTLPFQGGTLVVPTLSHWAMFCFITALMLTGVLWLRRRHDLNHGRQANGD
ncbi:MAG: hypothetical protein SF066_03805 [Thermoanaerobaculia bacterium]|nr:hypothetical protein [Thermoanaerobaculia bacterium]